MWPFSKKKQNPAETVPDGPYYRVAYELAIPGPAERRYSVCTNVSQMRERLIAKRAENCWARGQRSDDLGATWRLCDDMGRLIEQPNG